MNNLFLLSRIVLSLLPAAIMGAALGAVTINQNTLLTSGDLSLDGQDVIVDGATLTVAGAHTFASLQLVNGAVLTHEPAASGQPERAIRLTVTGNVTVDAASRIDVTGRGYAEATSPGAGAKGNYAGGGGGHGGRGHRSNGTPGAGGEAFGSIIAPDSWGGPGGNSDSTAAFVPGGGLVHLEVGGTLTIAGAVRADGASAWINNQGGGAGGTVYLKAATLAGSGTISANGGNGEWVDGGGGAGGRIALYFSSNLFTGTITAVGGGGYGAGGAGTIYLKEGAAAGEVRIAQEPRGEWTPLISPVAFNVTLGGNAIAYPTEPLTLGSLTIGGAAMLTHATGSTGLVVTVAGNLTIGPNAAINVDGRGYPFDGNRGPGAGTRADWAGTGAGHGGLGGHSATGVSGGPNYGSVLQPTALGSQGGDGNSGPGSAGGGAVRLNVGGILDVQGRLSANGLDASINNSGGGSGGSIWINAGTLTGGGSILANGGSGEWLDGGGGSGGRIALYFTTNQFTGPITAFGGGGAQKGGAGTIYLKRAADAVGELIVDNANVWGNYTPLTSPEAYRLTISGRAVCYPETALTVARFTMPGEAVLTHLTGQSNVNLHVTGDAIIAAGAQLTADGRGYPIGEDRGPGSGARQDWSGSGGGHGGLGGRSTSGAMGGGHYGSLLEPTTLGSQGGNADGGAGTAGGGAIRLIVDGRLTLDGRLSADGAGAPPNNAGGGAGGSLWLTVGTLSGTGVISANGGPGEWLDGGGGGGGRIAVYYGTNDFAGAITAFGGGGHQRGGAGTIYFRKTGSAFGQLLVHNGGAWGNYTPLTSPEPFQLTLAEMAHVYPAAPLTVRDLFIQTNSTLTHLTGQARCEVTVLNNATIAEGGSINTDGRGYPIGDDRGPGAGTQLSWGGSGAGHGGTGGRSASGAVGGEPYGSMTEPLTAGSAGGNGDGGPGGAGGGVVRLIVANELAVHGRISANGLNGVPNNAGGGAGGSLWLTAKTLSGTGAILADGGSGEWLDGGGGAGGRIALEAQTLAFTGQLFARGGGGHQRGGPGSIYFKVPGQPGGELVLNNDGSAGAWTPLQVPPQTRLVLDRGAAFYPIGPLDLVSLRLKPGSTLTHLNGQPGLTLHVAQDLTIEADAAINVDGRGYPVGDDPGPGAGANGPVCGGGGAHGGNGGVAWPGDVPGGVGYDSILEPTDFGSSGGGGDGSPTRERSPGGGAVRLVVDGTLTVDGAISANGSGAWYNNQGGAAGGSIWITAGRLAGAGSIRANGGPGEWVDGGSGGGGRIALYLGASEFTGEITARGAPGGREAGGAGTIYSRLAGDSVGELYVENGNRQGALTPLASPEPFKLVVAQQARVYGLQPLVLQSLEVATNAVLTHLKGDGGVNALVFGNATIAGRVFADGLGFPVGDDPGPGAGGSGTWAGGGAGHGGEGSPSIAGAPGGPAYGSALEPSTPGSQGGRGNSGPGTDGGGVIRLLVGGTLAVDGSITANALGGPVNNAGGGSGGSIYLAARTLTGAGEIRAAGAAGEWVEGGSGAGGRIAIYRDATTFTGTIAANGGSGGYRPGSNGTIHEAARSAVLWTAPAETWLSGEVPLEVAVFLPGGPFTVTFSVWRAGVEYPLATETGPLTVRTMWDTTGVAEGAYELSARVRDAGGGLLAEVRRRVTVNNHLIWHAGNLASDETWAAGAVHVVRGVFTVGNGRTLTVAPGAVVKFLTGARLNLAAGARLTATGAAAQPVTFTAFDDDSAGGDSNLDGDATRPLPGTWRLAVNAGAILEVNDHTRFRFNTRSFGGTLAASETWTADTLREITETVVVPAGVTLTLDAGAILKFHPGAGIDVQSGGRLVARGTLAQPVVLTSRRDDAWGGDTNEDGTRTRPAAGDWRSLRFLDGAEGELVHARVLFGGNSVGNPWGAGGAIETLGGPFTARNCVIADALKDGAFCYGTTRFENCLVLRCDRGLTAVGEMTVLHCTLHENKIGLLEHAGQLIVRNSIVSGSLLAGIEHDLGGHTPVITHCNVWNPDAPRGNYSGVSDRTGRDGNISAAPRYKDAAADNFRLNFASPGIDAADGAVATETDFSGVARYDDPRTGNTGTPAANGAVPDMGAFEFVEGAPSNLDLVVLGVSGPALLTAGEVVHVEWTVANRGAETFAGPWHDALWLRNVATGRRLPVAEVLVGRGVTLGPGQSTLASADVRVPGGVVGQYVWEVVGNSRGDLFEGAHSANNTGTAALASALTLPVIPLNGAPLAAAFTAPEELHWFQCPAPAGQDVRFALDLEAGTGVTELYVGRGFVPTPENFIARQREWAAPDTTAVASAGDTPTGETNMFYVLAVGRVLSATPAAFTVRAATADFSLERVWPNRVGNAGEVTLDIRGAGFSRDTTFAVRAGAESRPAVRQSWRERGRVFATFDLRGLPSGPADVVVEAGGLEVVLPAAVEVVAGGAPDFYVNLSGPGTTRAGRFMSWFVTYGNRGLVDLKLPLLKFSAPGATEILLYESTLNWADSFTFWGLNPEALLPTLGPGQEVTFEVRVKTFTAAPITVALMTGEDFAANTTPFNWSTLPPTPGADPVKWAAMVNGLNDRLGETLGEYQALLERELADLAAGEFQYSYLANINGRWLLGDEFEGESVALPIIEVPETTPLLSGTPGLHGPNVKLPPDGIRRTWVVLLTDTDYTGIGAKHLKGVAKDFADVKNYMLNELHVPPEQFYGQHDTTNDVFTWTHDKFIEALKTFKGQVDADDNLVVWFAGHGGRKPSGTPYLCLNNGYVSPVAFQNAINEVGAGTTYFVNDSCHSGAFVDLVNPDNTTFVGIAGTMGGRVSWENASGGELTTKLKAQLRKCRSLQTSFELAQALITHKYENKPEEKHRQSPVLVNKSGASLEGKPWNDPSGFWQRLDQIFRSPPFPGVVASGTFAIVGSVDPNDKYALAGAGPQRWVHPDRVLPFEIVFENLPTAAAPAQEVLVTDQLSTNLDWSTFELKAIGFNDARLTVPPGLQQFSTVTRVGTDPNEVVVDVRFDPYVGRVTWRMWSRDPATGELPEDPFAGFLPPNDATHRGEGSLSYTVRPKLGLADGTKIRNQATIIFDPTYGANPPIVTPVVTNTVDAVAPDSRVQALPAEVTGEVEVSWSGQDAPGGSGIASYDVYVSRNNGPYQLWQIATTATTAVFAGQPGSVYRFFSVARDAAGNTEAAPSEPDAVTTFAGGATFDSWITAQGVPPNARGPADDPDGDGLPNFAEYAHGLNPLAKDAALARPRAGVVQVGGAGYLSLTYRRPKQTPTDVEYRVTASTAVRPWSISGTVVPVGEPVDRGDHVEVTVRAAEPLTARAQGFLRLEVRR